MHNGPGMKEFVSLEGLRVGISPWGSVLLLSSLNVIALLNLFAHTGLQNKQFPVSLETLRIYAMIPAVVTT